MNRDPHFDLDMRFKQYDIDSHTGKAIMRLVEVNHPTKDLTSILRSSKVFSTWSKSINIFSVGWGR
jgi:hypothetical protein